MDYIIFDKKTSKEKLKEMSIFIGDNVEIKENVKLFAGVKLSGCCVVENNCEVGVNSVIINSHIKNNVKIISSFVEDCVIGENSTVGPFANLKKGSSVGINCRIGNFVEIKNSRIGNGVKIAHLTYVGDAEIKDDCNIGCGVVFCNYDGSVKRKSIIGEKVFIGSNVNIVAPVNIEDGAYIAAGSTINKDVLKNQFAIARERQTNKDNFDNPYLKHLKNK